MTYVEDRVSLCYHDGTFGWLVLFFAKFIVWTLWVGFTWFAFHSREFYFMLLSQTYWFSVIVQFTVATFVMKGDPPNTECNNDVLAVPPLYVWLLYHYLTMAVLYDIFEQQCVGHGMFKWIRRVVGAILLPAIWIYNGNATVVNSVYSALLGGAIGVILTSWIFVFWTPRRLYIVQCRPLTWIGCISHYDIGVTYSVDAAAASTTPKARLMLI